MAQDPNSTYYGNYYGQNYYNNQYYNYYGYNAYNQYYDPYSNYVSVQSSFISICVNFFEWENVYKTCILKYYWTYKKKRKKEVDNTVIFFNVTWQWFYRIIIMKPNKTKTWKH